MGPRLALPSRGWGLPSHLLGNCWPYGLALLGVLGWPFLFGFGVGRPLSWAGVGSSLVGLAIPSCCWGCPVGLGLALPSRSGGWPFLLGFGVGPSCWVGPSLSWVGPSFSWVLGWPFLLLGLGWPFLLLGGRWPFLGITIRTGKKKEKHAKIGIVIFIIMIMITIIIIIIEKKEKTKKNM